MTERHWRRDCEAAQPDVFFIVSDNIGQSGFRKRLRQVYKSVLFRILHKTEAVNRLLLVGCTGLASNLNSYS